MWSKPRNIAFTPRADPSRAVRWIADLDGDGAGHDVFSFDAGTGASKLIEVKTTCGDERTPFCITRNEEALSRDQPEAFRLYRLFDFSARPRIFELRPPLDEAVRLEATTWTASFE